jgi:hypothetical protein
MLFLHKTTRTELARLKTLTIRPNPNGVLLVAMGGSSDIANHNPTFSSERKGLLIKNGGRWNIPLL